MHQLTKKNIINTNKLQIINARTLHIVYNLGILTLRVFSRRSFDDQDIRDDRDGAATGHCVYLLRNPTDETSVQFRG